MHFLYEAVVATTFEDALIAVLLNPNIQSCLMRYSFPYRTKKKLRLLDEIYTILGIDPSEIESLSGTERSLHLGQHAQGTATGARYFHGHRRTGRRCRRRTEP